jgi:glycine cleavage system H protein
MLKADESFGDTEGKLNADLISPVPGKVLETNQAVFDRPAQRLNGTAFTNGWMPKIQISNPQELNNLVGPMYCAHLQSVGWTGPVPAMEE